MTNSPMVTAAQQKVLEFLSEHGNATTAEVATGLYVHPGELVDTNRMHGKRRATGTILRRLLAAGLVEEHPCSQDPSIWALSKTGRKAVKS